MLDRPRLVLPIREIVAARTPVEVLDLLQSVVEPLHVVGAAWLSAEGDADGYARSWHSSVPAEFSRKFSGLVTEYGADILAQAALHRPVPFTFTEAMQAFQPSGKDRWVFDLSWDCGMRDGFVCPTGAALIGYWSPRVLQGKLGLNHSVRMELEAVSSVAAIRLHELMAKSPPEEGVLSLRELAVLRQLATGKHLAEVAEHLSISVYTARTLQRRAQRKLKARTPLQAAVRATRRGLI